MTFHLVLGNGPAGAATARLLRDRGRVVRVVSRSVRQPIEGTEHVSIDAIDVEALTRVARGADVIYNCACPPYPRWGQDWPPLAAAVNRAAEDSGAVLVILSNLYGYGAVQGPMTEDLPMAPGGPKARARAEVWNQAFGLHRQHRLHVVEARASDFFGPGVVDGGHLAGRVMPAVFQKRMVRVLGDPEATHSWTYLPDVARTLVRLGEEKDAWGRGWHVPTVRPHSLRAMVDRLAERAGTAPVPVRRIPPPLVRAMGLFSPLLRELQEIRYQFDRPFVVDSGAYTRQFGEEPTALDEQVSATVQWWQDRLGEHLRG